ncbi:MAG TPA: hypothetical protein VNZ52_13715 [Candidatus Thermoplasmatota archaeon]|nr:hypothetical protein [Candidatus Thermoplasmatota archaeon]
MKLLRAVSIAAAALVAVSLALLYLVPVTPTGAAGALGRSFFGIPVQSQWTVVLLLLPLPFLGLAITAVVMADIRWGLGAAGLALVLAAGAPAYELTLGSLLFPLTLLLFVETLSAAHRFRAFEADARAAGAEVPLTAAEASKEYLRFAWAPLTLVTLLAAVAIFAHRFLPLLARDKGLTPVALYADSAEILSPYGAVLFGLAVLSVFALAVLVRQRFRRAR